MTDIGRPLVPLIPAGRAFPLDIRPVGPALGLAAQRTAARQVAGGATTIAVGLRFAPTVAVATTIGAPLRQVLVVVSGAVRASEPAGTANNGVALVPWLADIRRRARLVQELPHPSLTVTSVVPREAPLALVVIIHAT